MKCISILQLEHSYLFHRESDVHGYSAVIQRVLEERLFKFLLVALARTSKRLTSAIAARHQVHGDGGNQRQSHQQPIPYGSR